MVYRPRIVPSQAGMAAALAVVLAAVPATLAAQEQPTPADTLREEVTRLQERLDSLTRVVEELRAAGAGAAAGEEVEEEDELARLRAAAEAAAGEARGPEEEDEDEEPESFVGRQRSLQALNPEISVNVDLFGHLNAEESTENNFIPREFEFSFQSTLDPFSRAKIFVSHHVPGAEILPFGEDDGHGHGAEESGGFAVEEGYLEWVGLPGGVGVKGGRFFQRFGYLNRWHAHSLPFQTRSLPHLAFIGEESLTQTGLSLQWLLPIETGGTYETWLEVTRSENERLFGESDRPSVLGHVNAFWQLTRSLDLDLGVSGLFGEHAEEVAGAEAFGQRLYNVEGALTWRPPERSRNRELVLRGGWMMLDPDLPAEEPAAGPGAEEFGDRAHGLWSMAELRLSQEWLIGARFDWVENPSFPENRAWLTGPTLTWWQSEWVRLRAEWDYMDDGLETLNQLLLQVTFAMGPHKHETY